MFQPEHINTRSQDLREAYHDAGQFYWGKVPAFRAGLPFFAKDSKPVLIPRERVQEDTRGECKNIKNQNFFIYAYTKYKIF